MLSPRGWRRAGGWERAHRLIGGQGPSTFVEADAGSVRRLLAKDRMAAAAKRAVHLEVQAMVAALRKFGGLAAAVCLAKSLKPFILAAPFQIRNRLCMAFRTPTLLIMPQDRTPRRQAHNLLCPVLLHVWIAFVV